MSSTVIRYWVVITKPQRSVRRREGHSGPLAKPDEVAAYVAWAATHGRTLVKIVECTMTTVEREVRIADVK